MTRDPALELDRQRKLLAQANALLAGGKIRLHQEALAGAMDSILPDHPLRFSAIVRSPLSSQAELYVAWGKEKAEQPELSFNDHMELVWEGGTLGALSGQDRENVDALGELRPFYSVDVIEMRYADNNPKRLLYLAVELSRPELYLSEDGQFVSQHPHGSAEPVEVPPVLLARALEAEARRKSGGNEGRIARGSA